MTAAVPTLRALPADVDHDRRDLDRHAPAFIVTEADHTGRTTYSVCTRHNGITREVMATDGMDAHRIKALHTALSTYSPENSGRNPVLNVLVAALRNEEQS